MCTAMRPSSAVVCAYGMRCFHALSVVCDTKSEQTTVFTCCCSEPCGTVCKRKLDCNTVRFKKFVMYHDCLMRVPAGPRSSERSAPTDAMQERMPHPHGPITVYSVDFARFRLPSVGSRGCALLSHVGGRCTVARWRVPQTIARITERISIPSHLRQVSTSWQAALNARKGS